MTKFSTVQTSPVLVMSVLVILMASGGTQVQGSSCSLVLTSVRMEVSPVVLSAICHDNAPASLVIECGNSIWTEKASGFCSNFDLNIDEITMETSLHSPTITLQLMKQGYILDDARVVILMSKQLSQYRISVWGYQNTRFVLKVVRMCTSSPDGESPVKTTPSNSPYRRDPNLGLSMYHQNNLENTQATLVPTGNPHVSTIKQSNVPLVKYSRRILSRASLPPTVEPYDEPTTPRSTEMAKLEWMENKRVLFEQKMKQLRDVTPTAGVVNYPEINETHTDYYQEQTLSEYDADYEPTLGTSEKQFKTTTAIPSVKTFKKSWHPKRNNNQNQQPFPFSLHSVVKKQAVATGFHEGSPTTSPEIKKSSTEAAELILADDTELRMVDFVFPRAATFQISTDPVVIVTESARPATQQPLVASSNSETPSSADVPMSSVLDAHQNATMFPRINSNILTSTVDGVEITPTQTLTQTPLMLMSTSVSAPGLIDNVVPSPAQEVVETEVITNVSMLTDTFTTSAPREQGNITMIGASDTLTSVSDIDNNTPFVASSTSQQISPSVTLPSSNEQTTVTVQEASIASSISPSMSSVFSQAGHTVTVSTPIPEATQSQTPEISAQNKSVIPTTPLDVPAPDAAILTSSSQGQLAERVTPTPTVTSGASSKESAQTNKPFVQTTSNVVITPSKPSEQPTTTPPTSPAYNGTSQTQETKDEDGDILWPVVAALVIGIPSVVVFAIAITVIHRRRKPDVTKFFTMKTLNSTASSHKNSVDIGTLGSRSTLVRSTSNIMTQSSIDV